MPPAAFSVASFGLALSFLTRLNLPSWVYKGGSCAFEPAALARAVVWFPVVGLVVGLLCLVPIGGLYALAALAGQGLAGPSELAGLAGPSELAGLAAMYAPKAAGSSLAWLGAWLYVLTGFVLTRGLHWDGLADISDAWGSGAQGQRFWDIAKDSRLGAFGSMGQILVFSGLLIAAQGHISQCQWGPLVWACVLGRWAAIALAAHCPAREAHSLGAMAGAGATKARAYGWAAVLAAGTVLCWGVGSLLLLTLLLGGLLLFLARLARKQQGCNGDFLGTAIIGTELATLVALLL